MFFVIINALLYSITLFFYWLYKRQVDLGFIILAAFTFIAVLGVPYFYFINIFDLRHISLLPFIYLYIVLLLFIRPYLSVDTLNIINKTVVKSELKFKILTNLFIISAVVSIYILLPAAIENITTGEWRQLRNQLYEGDKLIEYGNFFERIMLIFNQYFRLIAILIFFYYISKSRVSRLYLILLGFAIIIPIFLVSINTASRGMLIHLVFELLAGFILFKKSITKKIRRKIYLTSSIFITVFLMYSLAVTNSRFGGSSAYSNSNYAANLSLLDYFGQPMINFNDGVADMHDYANGKYFFKYVLEAIGLDSNFNQTDLGGHWGTGFFTFIGSFYIDFGPIGTFLLALFFPLAIKRNVLGNVIYFENIYLYYFFYIFCLEGVFVTGYSAIISWLFALLIYLYLKF